MKWELSRIMKKWYRRNRGTVGEMRFSKGEWTYWFVKELLGSVSENFTLRNRPFTIRKEFFRELMTGLNDGYDKEQLRKRLIN